MSLVSDLLGAATSSSPAPGGAEAAICRGLMQHVLGMASDGQGNGLSGLISKLNAGGLSSAVGSWVGNGPNQPVSGNQIQSALGNDLIGELAQKFNIPSSQVAGHLSQILPEVINHLTPNGSVPEQSSLQSAVGLLRGQLGI